MNENFELNAPPVTPFIGQGPGQAGPESAFRTAFDLLARRAPKEALEVLEPAQEEPDNTGLLTLRAWAFLMRAQLQRAEADLTRLVEENPSDDWSRHALGRCLERSQCVFPESVEPAADGGEATPVERVQPPRAFGSVEHELRLLEHLQVLRHGGAAHGHTLGELPDGVLTRPQPHEDEAAGGITQRIEDTFSREHRSQR